MSIQPGAKTSPEFISTCAPTERRIGHRDPVEGRDDVARLRERRGNRRRDAPFVRLGKSDPQVEIERFGNLLAKERAERATGDAAHDLADEMAVRERVVAVARAGRPQRRLLGEPVHDELPVAVPVLGNRLRERGEPGLMCEQHAHGDRVLAVLRELRPVRRDRRVEVELAARDEHVRAQRGGALGARPDHADRVAFPRPPGRGVGAPAPEVDDRLAVERHADGGADLAALGEVAFERVADRLELRIARAGRRSFHDRTTFAALAASGPLPRFGRRALPREDEQATREHARSRRRTRA